MSEQGKAWADALHAAALFAVAPIELGGVVVRARVGPVRQRWCDLVQDALPEEARPWRLPPSITEDRLLGGLDLAETLRRGRVVVQVGLLASAHRGVVMIPMAERLERSTVAHLSAALDQGIVRLEREGLTRALPCRVGVVALDEGLEDERVAEALRDRLALHVALDAVSRREAEASPPLDLEALAAARARLPQVTVGDDLLEALCRAAVALGVRSLRGPQAAITAARVAAALAGRSAVAPVDAQLAARLVLGPRATHVPEVPAEDPSPPEPPEGDAPEPPADDPGPTGATQLADVVLAAATSALPAGLLAQLSLEAGRGAARSAGPAGALRGATDRGRPVGIRRGTLRPGQRLNVVETLRAAAPWQPLRRAASGRTDRVEVRPDDFRITRYKRRTATTTIFVVDASGSAALQRLAEAKGAVEQVLADCYVRRDQVALVAFRGQGAELLLPPTRSLVRARRSLAGLPGGGATPLAAGLSAGRTLAEDVRRRGQTPILVVMTDGRANVALDGGHGRANAHADALAVARSLAAAAVPALFVDTAPRPQAQPREVAEAMGARYLHLPYADPRAIAAGVAGATP